MIFLKVERVNLKNELEGENMLKDLCFEVIQTCPNNCKFCSSNSSQDKQTIFLHPDLFEMVKFCKDKEIRTVIFTSGIKRASAMPMEMIEYIKNRCEQDLQEIEEHEPWNERLKRNVKAYYDRWLTPNHLKE